MSSPLGIFERYLSLWVVLSIFLGVFLGSAAPAAFEQIAAFEYAHVNLLVAAFMWLMIYPMMVQIDFSAIKEIGNRPKGLIMTLIINWAIKPFTMALIAWTFFYWLFADFVSPEDAQEYVSGMILLGVAPCTAMVFVWSQLTKGNANYTLVQVAANDLVMVFAFAPIAGVLLGVNQIEVPWTTLIASVLLYIVLPLLSGVLTRLRLLKYGGVERLEKFKRMLKPGSILSLLATVVLLFGFQAKPILSNPVAIILIAIPLLIQTYGIFFLSYAWARWWKLPHDIAIPACMIGTSNFFELAVAVAISLFGLNSGAALATVVGVLVEVPVMLSLVALANRWRSRWQAF
jgi:ACR3 family arsenite transporter